MADVSLGTPVASQTEETVSTQEPPQVVFTTQHNLNHRGTTSATDELVVVMPTRVRVDSRVVLAHCTTSWLSNCSLCILILAKEYFIKKQLGPPPPQESSPGLQLQYDILKSSRMRTFIIDSANQGLEGLGLVAAKLLFVLALEKKWTSGGPWGSFRMVFSPVWIAWVVITCLSCLKNRHERILGGARDLTFLFLLFVAFKLDNQSSYSWRLVFLIPWMWFSAMFLLTCMFISYIALVDKLDGDSEVSNRAILIPNAASWLMMWLSSIVVCRGLYQKEELRASLQAAGAVWTASEQIARQMHQTMEAAQKRIDDLTEGEIANLVQEMMQGKTKPSHLVRIGGALFKRMSAGLAQGSEPPESEKETTKDACNLLSDVGQEEDMIGTNIEMFSLPREVSTPPGTCGADTSNSKNDGERVDSTLKLHSDVVLDVEPEEATVLLRAVSSTSDDKYCIICYDGVASCVFLECGHGGFCRKCANKLFVRPPNECPTCRQKIDQVVELTVSGEIGEVLSVKQ
ncbi:hypothetical protein BSKO_11649 [Bryopsis sp. KO-2023]|nr:hypothetical protein BSKO_11649 [Bryopsis sp. KO-2023]